MNVLPDVDDLMADPYAYLQEAPLAIGPRRMYRLAGLFAVPGLVLLLSCLVLGRPDGERIALGVGLLVGAAVWLGWSLALRGHELVFHPDGLEIVYRDSSVWAPWALFHVENRPFVPQSDSRRAGRTIPINPAALPYVELRRGGMTVAWGRQIRAPQWQLTGLDELVLPARYEVEAQDIGELVLVLGHRLGTELPGTVPPPEADEPAPELPLPADPTAWFTVPLTRLKLPPCCARCGGPRDDTLRLRVTARADWIVDVLVGGLRGVEIPVPVCDACKERLVTRQRNGGYIGLAVGAILGAGVGLAIGGLLGEGRDLALYLGAFTGLFLGSFAGSMLGLFAATRMPVQVRNYSPSRGLVRVRFENPEVGARVQEALRSNPGAPPRPRRM
ncbi:MAG: hypothetical protein U0736_04840 [Gemmataceae bacterium]